MPNTLPTAEPAVNALFPWRQFGYDQLVIWATLGGLALLGYLSGAEIWLAQTLYQPDLAHPMGALAWDLRQYGAAIPGYMAVAALLALFWPQLWQTRPWLYRGCAVLALTALLGAGLINQVLTQELADRHRPRETLLIGQSSHTLPAELEGNSMPSGHAGIAFCLAAPFFAWRRQRPQLAKAALGLGLAAGAVVGGGRMVLGAHYLSDVLIAGAIALATAALLAPLLERIPRIPKRFLMVFFALAGVAVVLGNHFKLTLTAPLPTPLPKIELPCTVQGIPGQDSSSTLVVQLKGYGAPVSGLKLAVTPKTVRLERGWGVFHSLQCAATLELDARSQE